MCITRLFVNNLHQICMWYADGNTCLFFFAYRLLPCFLFCFLCLSISFSLIGSVSCYVYRLFHCAGTGNIINNIINIGEALFLYFPPCYC